ncbi:MAG: HpcH/HpaI aldolase/citrate lyase family protein [Gammaproteobacteria bacterium]
MRSFLFVPGDRPDRFVKAEATGADAVILDLEDAVTPEQRPTARAAIATHLAARTRSSRSVPLWVRINPIQTPDALADLAAVLPGRPDGIVLPKARHGDDVHRLDHWLEALESQQGIEVGSTCVMPMVTETASALLTMSSFSCVPKRVAAFTWGAEDLATELGALGNRDAAGEYELPYALASALTLYAASAAGVPAIDTVDTEIRDTAAVERRARASRRAGFVGKLAIHPSQVAVLNTAFTPTADEIAHAEKVRDAFAAAPTAGALRVDGKLVDRPHLLQAERMLAAARAAAAR